MKLFVTAIGTGCGKTIVSSILTEALQADYWKPIQAGTLESDSQTVKSLISNSHSVIHSERFLLQTPASPHHAANVDKVSIHLSDFELPKTENHLIIEGAGGLLVPINENGDYVIDLASRFDAEIILVSNIYLGSINHTLLSINELQRRKLKIKGIVFNGERNESTERIILKNSGLKCILRIEQETSFTREAIKYYAAKIHL